MSLFPRLAVTTLGIDPYPSSWYHHAEPHSLVPYVLRLASGLLELIQPRKGMHVFFEVG